MKRVFFLLIIMTILWAQEEPARLRVTLQDGSVIVGRFVSETAEVLIMESTYGGQITIPLTDIVKRETITGAEVTAAPAWPPDRNYSRYLWSPTAFALRAKHGYCNDACLFLPSFAWGITDNFSVLGGITLIPGVRIGDQLLQLAGKLTLIERDRLAVAAGIQYFGMSIGDEFDVGFGFVFGTATIGDHNSHYSGSIGYGFARAGADGESASTWMDRPLLTLSGIRRISKNLSIITENWLIPEVEISDSPLSLGIRFIGDRLSVNLAGIFLLSMFQEGLVIPFPWIDFSFHLGR
ncbi:MAG: hypothetical protein JSW54_08010 [Fidelibacterota bacterium]|nr:MAG: hypothetical protein JSW54_08010 [Candidatus Neomarinimicrobiota bacterium]